MVFTSSKLLLAQVGGGISSWLPPTFFTKRRVVYAVTLVTVIAYLFTLREMIIPNLPMPYCEHDERSFKKRPLMIFPLLKELGAGWHNMQIPALLQKRAHGSRSLIVDVGLDEGFEFFLAIENGFEVVGFEPNPVTFPALAQKCRALNTSNCHVLENLSSLSLPLNRTPGDSYLINAAVGAVAGELELFTAGPGSSFQPHPEAKNDKSKWQKVPVVRIDDFIQEDVYLFKIDTQGFDPFVLQGAAKVFRFHVVRQLIFEVEPLAMSRNNITMTETMEMLQDYGMLCFNERLGVGTECEFRGDTVQQFEELYFSEKNVKVESGQLWAQCWEDFVCINIEKPYTGADLPVYGINGVG
jgi:FkbM family methyltransferase